MNTETTLPETLQIDNLDQFVKMLVHWHSAKVRVLEHMLQIPEGTAIISDSDNPITLTKDTLDGFKVGITISLMELGSLPFDYKTEEIPTNEPAQA